MRFHLGAATLLLLVTSGIVGAAQIPIAVSGYNQDFIVGASETYATGLTGSMDGGAGATTGNTWYGVGFNSGAPTTGLPNGVYTSESDSNTTLQLASFTSNNTALINSSSTSATLTLTTPAQYSTLSLFGSTGSGNNTVNYTLNFADASTQSGTLSFGDWFGGGNVAITANGRVNEGGFDNVNAGNPRVYQDNIAFSNPGAALTSISLSYASGGGNTGILALSGTPAVPEPATCVLFALGGIGLLVAARRRQ